MSTARDLIKNSLRLVGAIATGENLDANEAADGLLTLNNLLDSWSNERLLVPYMNREQYNFVPGVSAYTIGPTGAFNSIRPVKIEAASVVVDGGSSYEVPMDIIYVDEWARIPEKSLRSSIPTKLYFEGTSPDAIINVWPTPSGENTFIIYSQRQLTSFASLDDEIVLAPGYARALTYNLAVEISPEYGKEPSGTVMMIAREAKENIKRTNIQAYIMDFDDALVSRGTFNYETGE